MRPSLVLEHNREKIRAILAQHRASNVRVFGSALRGEDTEASDLDLLVDVESDVSGEGTIRNRRCPWCSRRPFDTRGPARILAIKNSLGSRVDMIISDRDAAYMQHMMEAISRVREYVAGKDKEDFLRERLLQDGIIRNIEIVGEAANRLSPAFADSTPEIPWREIAGMRHRLIHGYMAVNLNTVWNVVERELPKLQSQVQMILENKSS